MLGVYDLKNRTEYIKQVATLEHDQWAQEPNKDRAMRIEEKVKKIISNFPKRDFCKLVLLENTTLVGFISLFPTDSDERRDLTPWYATMYVKKEYRGRGYSKLLNNALLKEAKKRGYNRLYLKTDLKNYYEKFGAKYIGRLRDGESLYYINTK